MTFLEKTRKLLNDRPRSVTFAKIQKETGLTESWLKMVASGSIKDPSVNLVEKLYVYLSGKQMGVE